MTTPPLPASPCLRVKLDYQNNAGGQLGSRFYLSYSNSAPTSGNCSTLASDVAAAWASHIAPFVDEAYSLREVDVLDIATDSGSSGQWTGDNPGGNTGTSLTGNAAVNVEFDIARRYRGGKPRMFFPPDVAAALGSIDQWSPSTVTSITSYVGLFFSEIEALSIGAMGTLQHVNLSYYKGFTNITNSSGRERAVPTYRDTALLDTVNGYACKATVGSQRRRRTSTTP